MTNGFRTLVSIMRPSVAAGIAALCAVTVASVTARAVDSAAEAPPAEISEDVRLFCSSFADEARDRRYDLKRMELEELEADIEKRITALEEKRHELESWFKKREDFINKAEASLVGIYKNMRPDAAAERMEELGPELVAALLMKLPERAAGVILNEMDAARAALVTNVMVAAADEETKQ